MPLIADAIILLFILLGAVSGAKKGVIYSAVDFIGTLTCIILAFFLKNPLSVLMYTHLPFFNFTGAFQGISVVNILIYEAIAYVIVLSVLFGVLKLIIKLSGLVEKILKATVVLGIPSKILGFVFGAIEAYLFAFVVIFLVNQIPNTISVMAESHVGRAMLSNTPVLSEFMSDSFKSIDEIYKLVKEQQNTHNTKETNKKAFEILLKNEVLTADAAQKLVDNKKIDIDNAKEIINQYK